MTFVSWGQTIIETDVDRAVISQLRLWLPSYLYHLADERGLPALKYPASEAYENALEDDTFPEAKLPAVVVTTAQPESDATHDHEAYSAAWRVNVSAVVRGRQPGEARELAAVFNGAVRRVLHDQGVQDLDAVLYFRRSQVVPVADITGENRYLAAGINTFTAFVDDIMSGDGPVVDSPIYPPPDPTQPEQEHDPLAVVDRVNVTVTHLED